MSGPDDVIRCLPQVFGEEQLDRSGSKRAGECLAMELDASGVNVRIIEIGQKSATADFRDDPITGGCGCSPGERADHVFDPAIRSRR